MSSVQDRTAEFLSVLALAQKQQAAAKVGSQRRSLLTDEQKSDADSAGRPRQSNFQFAQTAANIGRGISATTAKLEKLAQLARRRTLFDDRPVEINELTFVIKQDLHSLNQDILSLQDLLSQKKATGRAPAAAADQCGEHHKNVVVLLQGKLTDVSVTFKDVLEERTRNIQESRSRTEDFISSVTQHAHAGADARSGGGGGGGGLRPPGGALTGALAASASPLYGTPLRGTPSPATVGSAGGADDVLSLRPATDHQLLMMEEAQDSSHNAYVQQRGEAIETIERTISELGNIFGQLAAMVQEQGEQIQRIDAYTDDVVDNVDGAQRELLKYWSRVSGNRWLIAKMFGVLMIFFLVWVLVAG